MRSSPRPWIFLAAGVAPLEEYLQQDHLQEAAVTPQQRVIQAVGAVLQIRLPGAGVLSTIWAAGRSPGGHTSQAPILQRGNFYGRRSRH
jgi:hypothetical protein